ncbi:PAS domain S-box protein [Adhaeribacter aquaticus]|uniref:PAS domain S-box protein n=1 Tax=Adhaeribacter aquaticus TaxID=299567 RepID=UPI0006858C51|nr:PAS domain S-box protein [Adhaeribacter aquaticus]
MTILLDFFKDLFDPNGFPARWVCGKWTPFHGWTYILSSLAIWLAYFAIPFLLFLFLRRKKEVLPFGRIFWLFIAFIFACGVTHLSDSIMFWYPAYRMSALILFITAIISWVAVITLAKSLPQLLTLKTPKQIEEILQKQFESLTQQLRESEERWQFALEGSQLGVWDWDAQKKQVFYSKKWKEIIGYEDHEIQNDSKEWESRLHPEDKTATLAEIDKHASGETPFYKAEYRLRCKDGSYKWIRASAKITYRLPNGKPGRIVGTHEDIHYAKEFQEQLRLSENTFSSAFTYSGIGMAFVSPAGCWLNVNPALCRLLGFSKEELLKKTVQELTYPEDLEVDMEYVQKMLHKEISSYQMEKRYFHKNGQIIWVMLTVSLVWENTNEPKFFISEIVDITNTKHLITALEQKNEALQVTALDLEGKIEQVEEFNKIVAHNLRGPAGNIKILLEALPTDYPDIESNIYFNMLNQANVNMLDTLDELMKVLEVRLNKEIEFNECDLEETLNKILLSFKAQIIEKNAIIDYDLAEPIIKYPKVYLESILHNLMSNALKYSQPSKRPIIKVMSYTEKGKLYLTVKDNGLGIDLDTYGKQVFKLKKIFHPGYDSKGVGLFITKNQIETFGGSIAVKSVPLEGSEFTIKF